MIDCTFDALKMGYEYRNSRYKENVKNKIQNCVIAFQCEDEPQILVKKKQNVAVTSIKYFIYLFLRKRNF